MVSANCCISFRIQEWMCFSVLGLSWNMQRDIGTLHLELLHTQECNFQGGMCRRCICATAQYASYLLLVCKVALLRRPRWNFRIFTQWNASLLQINVQGAFLHFLFVPLQRVRMLPTRLVCKVAFQGLHSLNIGTTKECNSFFKTFIKSRMPIVTFTHL